MLVDKAVSSQVIHSFQSAVCTEFIHYKLLIINDNIDKFELLTEPTTTTVYI